MEYLRIILNNALYLSLIIILLSSIIGVFMAGRKRDKCLKDFDGFECRVQLTNGKVVYGILKTFGSGIEIQYSKAHNDTQGHVESSFILYLSELGQISSIQRFHDDLSLENKNDRRDEIKATYHPGFLRIFNRKIRNFINTFQDGFNQSLSTILGAIATRNPKTGVAARKKELNGLGTQVLGVVSHAYDSILEQYIGHYVVLERTNNNQIEEYCGILKDYTQGYLELLNLIEIEHSQIDVSSKNTDDSFCVLLAEKKLVNNSDWPIYVQSIEVDNNSIPVEIIIDSKTEINIEKIPENLAGYEKITASLITPRVHDMIIPRELGVIRHGCPRSQHTIETLLGLSSSEIVQAAILDQFKKMLNAQISKDQNEN